MERSGYSEPTDNKARSLQTCCSSSSALKWSQLEEAENGRISHLRHALFTFPGFRLHYLLHASANENGQETNSNFTETWTSRFRWQIFQRFWVALTFFGTYLARWQQSPFRFQAFLQSSQLAEPVCLPTDNDSACDNPFDLPVASETQGEQDAPAPLADCLSEVATPCIIVTEQTADQPDGADALDPARCVDDDVIQADTVTHLTTSMPCFEDAAAILQVVEETPEEVLLLAATTTVAPSVETNTSKPLSANKSRKKQKRKQVQPAAKPRSQESKSDAYVLIPEAATAEDDSANPSELMADMPTKETDTVPASKDITAESDELALEDVQVSSEETAKSELTSKDDLVASDEKTSEVILTLSMKDAQDVSKEKKDESAQNVEAKEQKQTERRKTQTKAKVAVEAVPTPAKEVKAAKTKTKTRTSEGESAKEMNASKAETAIFKNKLERKEKSQMVEGKGMKKKSEGHASDKVADCTAAEDKFAVKSETDSDHSFGGFAAVPGTFSRRLHSAQWQHREKSTCDKPDETDGDYHKQYQRNDAAVQSRVPFQRLHCAPPKSTGQQEGWWPSSSSGVAHQKMLPAKKAQNSSKASNTGTKPLPRAEAVYSNFGSKVPIAPPRQQPQIGQPSRTPSSYADAAGHHVSMAPEVVQILRSIGCDCTKEGLLTFLQLNGAENWKKQHMRTGPDAYYSMQELQRLTEKLLKQNGLLKDVPWDGAAAGAEILQALFGEHCPSRSDDASYQWDELDAWQSTGPSCTDKILRADAPEFIPGQVSSAVAVPQLVQAQYVMAVPVWCTPVVHVVGASPMMVQAVPMNGMISMAPKQMQQLNAGHSDAPLFASSNVDVPAGKALDVQSFSGPSETCSLADTTVGTVASSVL